MEKSREPMDRELRPILDTITTVLVIAASIAVLAITLRLWYQAPTVAGPVIPQPTTPAPPAEPQALKGTPLIGSPAAKVAIIQYSDFECPFCRSFYLDTWPTLKQEYVDSGRVRVAFRHLPLPSHQFAHAAALAATCANQQERFWDMHDLLFQNQDHLSEGIWPSLARQLRLDVTVFDDCMNGSVAAVERDQNSASALSIIATPTFLVGHVQTDGDVRVTQILVGAHPLARFKEILDGLLADLS
jgi:protein-disulfide isomerase